METLVAQKVFLTLALLQILQVNLILALSSGSFLHVQLPRRAKAALLAASAAVLEGESQRLRWASLSAWNRDQVRPASAGGRHLGRRGVPERHRGSQSIGNKAQKVGCGRGCWELGLLLKDGPQGFWPLDHLERVVGGRDRGITRRVGLQESTCTIHCAS